MRLFSFGKLFCDLYIIGLDQASYDATIRASLVPRPFLYALAPPIQEGSGNQTRSEHDQGGENDYSLGITRQNFEYLVLRGLGRAMDAATRRRVSFNDV